MATSSEHHRARPLRTALLLAGVLPAAGCGDFPESREPPAGRGKLASVEVVMSVDGEPAVDGLLMVFPRDPRQLPGAVPTARTDSTGKARVDSLPPGAYVLQVYPRVRGRGRCTTEARGFGPWDGNELKTDTLELAAGRRAAFEIKLTCPFVSLRPELDSIRRLEPGGVPFPDTPVVSGKLLVVGEEGIDAMTFQLPEHLRPETPEEVRTFAVLHCGREMVGVYSGGTAAWQQGCSVTIVDRASREALSWRGFSGGPPPGAVRTGPGGGPGEPPEGRHPAEQIRAYLSSARPRDAAP